MTNRNARSFYCIKADLHYESPARPNEVFIGLFKDRKYHVLGCRPDGMDYLLPDYRQSQEDWATIKFPEGVKRLEDMKPDSLFTTSFHSGTEVASKFYGIKYKKGFLQIKLERVKISFSKLVKFLGLN